jgi:hypothetical protein
MDKPVSLYEVQQMIEKLSREDRALLRPWILARYDVRGYRAIGYGTRLADVKAVTDGQG